MFIPVIQQNSTAIAGSALARMPVYGMNFTFVYVRMSVDQC